MIHRVDIVLSPSQSADPAYVRDEAVRTSGAFSPDVTSVRLVRRSVDARAKYPRIRIVADVFVSEAVAVQSSIVGMLPYANQNKRVVIIGAGPAGYFAALECLEHGIKPVILERGKDVRSRRRDLRAIQQEGIVDPHSNYCFGEGGAGTYSDGKLYTRSHKRGSISKVLQLLVEHGAPEDILIDTHPHIGSNKLWLVVQAIRETILRLGGEIHFETFVTDLLLHVGAGGSRKAVGAIAEDGREFLGEAVILATGHSARDVFELCKRSKIEIEAKPFALGVRIEHSQDLIDSIQYHHSPRDPNLPASSYKMVCQTNGRGVFTFCMCPGGLIVPSATSPGEIVVNGMSMSRRDSPFANSGTVVAVEQEDWKDFQTHGALAGVAYQSSVERTAFESNGDGTQRAPAQRLIDFLDGKVSGSIPPTSYIPGHASVDMRSILPHAIDSRLRVAIREFGASMKGYLTNEAVMVGVESRTSSPVRIPRDPVSREHISVGGLFPCGEGAGYAGGIVSAALDGQNVAQAIAARIFSAA